MVLPKALIPFENSPGSNWEALVVKVATANGLKDEVATFSERFAALLKSNGSWIAEVMVLRAEVLIVPELEQAGCFYKLREYRICYGLAVTGWEIYRFLFHNSDQLWTQALRSKKGSSCGIWYNLKVQQKASNSLFLGGSGRDTNYRCPRLTLSTHSSP